YRCTRAARPVEQDGIEALARKCPPPATRLPARPGQRRRNYLRTSEETDLTDLGSGGFPEQFSHTELVQERQIGCGKVLSTNLSSRKLASLQNDDRPASPRQQKSRCRPTRAAAD